ncbi:amidohydrolase family protein [Tistrella bauzanensis]
MIAFDAHVHVYDRVAAAGPVRYLPSRPALLSDWLARLAAHGLIGGVIVQVSFLGTDNHILLDTLERLDRRRFAGVAVVDIDSQPADLRALAAGGIRGCGGIWSPAHRSRTRPIARSKHFSAGCAMPGCILRFSLKAIALRRCWRRWPRRPARWSSIIWGWSRHPTPRMNPGSAPWRRCRTDMAFTSRRVPLSQPGSCHGPSGLAGGATWPPPAGLGQ